MPLEYSPNNMGITIDLQGIIASKQTLCHSDTHCLRAIKATAFLVNDTKKTVMGSPLTIFVPHIVEVLLYSQHIQHFSVSHLTSYKVLPLIAPHITLLHFENLNPATLFLFITNEVSHDCLTPMDQLLTPCDDLQETPLGNADFSWFTDCIIPI